MAWRNLDSLFVSIRDYLEQSQANEVEIRILEERLQRTADGDSRLADKLLRAYERQLRVRSHYYQAVAEYNKSITDLHYLKGTLGDGSTSPSHME